jgi:hypothetical protein
MEMKRMNGGSLRAAGYDARDQKLVVELTAGTFEYTGVTPEMWRRFSGASSPWSYFRDNIEEEFAAGACVTAVAPTRAEGPPRASTEATSLLNRQLAAATAAFLASFSSSTPFSYFASLAFSSSSTAARSCDRRAEMAFARQHAPPFPAIGYPASLPFSLRRRVVTWSTFDRDPGCHPGSHARNFPRGQHRRCPPRSRRP